MYAHPLDISCSRWARQIHHRHSSSVCPISIFLQLPEREREREQVKSRVNPPCRRRFSSSHFGSPCQHLHAPSSDKSSLLFHSTGRILLFYLIFYAALSAFFMAMWFIFASTLIDGRPKYELEDSIIGNNPGLGFRPMPPESNVESTLIWYQKHNPENSGYWVNETRDFLKGESAEISHDAH